MSKLIRLALVASVLYGTGAHWAALQSYAWASMAVSGQKDPCSVCKMVEKGTVVEQAPLALQPAPSVDLVLVSAPVLNAVLSVSTMSDVPFDAAPGVPFDPAVPPPKTALPV